MQLIAHSARIFQTFVLPAKYFYKQYVHVVVFSSSSSFSSFHVVVLVYCQTYMFLFSAFILSVCMHVCICPPVYLLVPYGE